MKHAMQGQRGIGLLALLFFLILAIFAVTVAVKLGPHYMGYLTVRSVMQGLREEEGDQSSTPAGKMNVLTAVGKRLYINGITTVDRKDFKYKKTEKGYDLSVEYEVREHLFANVDAVLSFSHEVQVDTK